MAQVMESTQVGKRESLADLIAVADSSATPYTSMLPKRKRPDQMDHSWQMKKYRVAGHRGVIDGKDATDFKSTPRKRVHCYSQKIWDPVAVSDLAEEAKVAGVKSELAAQVEDAFVVSSQIIERRALSNVDTSEEDAPAHGYETRGALSWLSPNAQATFPVPAEFRPGSDQIYTGTLANFTEEDLVSMANAAAKRRKGPATLDGFIGLDLKKKINDFTRYDDEVTDKVAIRRFNQSADDKQVITVIDRLVLDSGTIRLHPSYYLCTDPDTGEATDYTDKSAVFMDMKMAGLAYSRLPRVFPMPYLGGGHKKVVDAIFLHQIDNPMGMFSALINS